MKRLPLLIIPAMLIGLLLASGPANVSAQENGPCQYFLNDYQIIDGQQGTLGGYDLYVIHNPVSGQAEVVFQNATPIPIKADDPVRFVGIFGGSGTKAMYMLVDGDWVALDWWGWNGYEIWRVPSGYSVTMVTQFKLVTNNLDLAGTYPLVRVDANCADATPTPTPTQYGIILPYEPCKVKSTEPLTATLDPNTNWSITDRFDLDLGHWASGGTEVKRLAAPSKVSTDQAGVAFIPYDYYSDSFDETLMLRYAAVSASITGTVRIKGWAKTTSLPAGNAAYIRVWGKQYATSDAELLTGDDQHTAITTADQWSFFDVTFTAAHDYSLLYLSAFSVGDQPADDPLAGAAGVRLDDATIAVGEVAVFDSYPSCSTSSPLTDQPMKWCQVGYIDIDVYSACPTPDLLDIGGWVNWLGCRLQNFFAFNRDNQRQLSDLPDRQRASEPFGTIIEVYDSLNDFKTLLDRLQSDNHTGQPVFDFSLLFDFTWFNDPGQALHLQVGSLSSTLSNCPTELMSRTGPFYSGACLALVSARNTVAARAMQLFLNVGALVGFITFVFQIVKGIARG